MVSIFLDTPTMLLQNTRTIDFIDVSSILNESNLMFNETLLFYNKSLIDDDTTTTDFILSDTVEYKFYTISKVINVYAITIITLLGLLGNMLSIYIFCNEQYKRMPLQIYLLSLSISDVIVLFTHYIDFTFRGWINLHGLYDSNINFVDRSWLFCKLVSYLRNVFRTTSAYIMLLMTWERFIALYFPMKKTKLCSFRINKLLIKILMLFSFLFNSSILYLFDIVKDPSSTYFMCEIKETLKTTYFYLNVSFVLFTILIPIVVVGTFTYILLRKITEYISIASFCCTFERNYLNFAGQKAVGDNSLGITQNTQHDGSTMNVYRECPQQNNNLFLTATNVNNLSQNANGGTSVKPNYSLRTTYMLIILSKWFIILHIPYFICWLILNIDEFNNQMMNSNIKNTTMTSNSEFTLFTGDVDEYIKTETRRLIIRAFHNISEVIYITNYAINFLLYTVNGKLFRQRYKQLLAAQFRKCCSLFKRRNRRRYNRCNTISRKQ